MKKPHTFLLSLAACSSVALAGDVSKEVIPPPMQAVDNPYFMGATLGYLDTMDTEFYSIHFGKDLNQQLFSWDQALYLELGYAEMDESYTVSGMSTLPQTYQLKFELIPLTLNYKLEKEISPNFNAYLGAGAGVAFTSSDISGAATSSDSDTVFFTQAFAGILYNVNQNWEVFGGARFIYFDEPNNATWDMIQSTGKADNSDWLGEIGVRYNF